MCSKSPGSADARNITVSRLAIGPAQFGLDYGITNSRGRVPEHEVESILSASAQHGIAVLDTAAAYGKAEAVLGAGGAANTFRVVSKIKPDHATDVVNCLRQSAKLLRSPIIDTILLHDAEVLKSDSAVWPELLKQKAAGRVAKVGLSVYTPDQVQRILTGCKVNQWEPPDVLQFPVSVFDQRFIPFLQSWKVQGIELHARSLYLQGAGFFDTRSIPGHLSGLAPSIGRLCHLESEFGISRTAFLLAYGLMHSELDYLVIGVDSLRRLHETVAAYQDAKQLLMQYEAQKDHLVARCKELALTDERIILPSNWKEQQ